MNFAAHRTISLTLILGLVALSSSYMTNACTTQRTYNGQWISGGGYKGIVANISQPGSPTICAGSSIPNPTVVWVGLANSNIYWVQTGYDVYSGAVTNKYEFFLPEGTYTNYNAGGTTGGAYKCEYSGGKWTIYWPGGQQGRASKCKSFPTAEFLEEKKQAEDYFFGKATSKVQFSGCQVKKGSWTSPTGWTGYTTSSNGATAVSGNSFTAWDIRG